MRPMNPSRLRVLPVGLGTAGTAAVGCQGEARKQVAECPACAWSTYTLHRHQCTQMGFGELPSLRVRTQDTGWDRRLPPCPSLYPGSCEGSWAYSLDSGSSSWARFP